MADQFPELTDTEVDFLGRLSGVSDSSQHPSSGRTSLNDALRYLEPLDGMNTKALVRPTINKAVKELSRLTAAQGDAPAAPAAGRGHSPRTTARR